jgi:hypothetical protein
VDQGVLLPQNPSPQRSGTRFRHARIERAGSGESLVTGEDRARLDTQNVRHLGIWTEQQERKSRTSLICISLALLIAGIGWMVFGLV